MHNSGWLAVAQEVDVFRKKDQECINTIIDSIADGIFIIDCEQTITYFNHAAEKITGVSKEQAIGKNVLRSSGAAVKNARDNAF